MQAASLENHLPAFELGTRTLPQVTGLPYGFLVFAVVLMAVGGFAGATWVEKTMAARAAAAARQETA